MKFYLFCFFVALALSQILAPRPGNVIQGDKNTLIYSQGNFVFGNENGFLNSGNNQVAGNGNSFINTDGNLVIGQGNSISCQPPVRPPAKIALRVKGNGKFVSAQNAGKNSLIANRDKIGPWETFNIIDLGSSKIALQAIINGQYVCAQSAGARPLIAKRIAIGPQQTFTLEKVQDGYALKSQADNEYVSAGSSAFVFQALISNKKTIGAFETFTFVKFYDIAIISVSNGKFVTTESGALAPLFANRDELGPRQKFTLIELGNNKVAIQSQNNGQYVFSERAVSSSLIASRGVIGPLQTFTIVPIQKGIAFKSQANGKFVCSQNNRGSRLIANRDHANIQQTFQILYI